MRFVVTALLVFACGHPGQAPLSASKPEAATLAPSSLAPSAPTPEVATLTPAAPAALATALAAPAQPSPPEEPRSTETYSLVVSFGSECCGTDHQAARALERLLEGYKPEALGRETGAWGEEGEYDLCFTLVGLSEAQRRHLVRVVKTNIRRKLVAVRENAVCNHSSPAETGE